MSNSSKRSSQRRRYRSSHDEPAEVIVVYTPGGCHKFYEELGPITRSGARDPKAIAAVFTKHDMTLLGRR